MIPNEEQEESLIRGGAFDDVLSKQGPFMHGGKLVGSSVIQYD